MIPEQLSGRTSTGILKKDKSRGPSNPKEGRLPVKEHTRYKVVLLGINPGDDPVEARAGLARVFRFDPAKIEKLLARLPVVLKSDLDYKAAVKYRAVLYKAGGACRLEPMGPVEMVSPTIKTCPRCGYEAKSSADPLLTAHDGRGECPECGVIISKLVNKAEDEREPSSVPVQDISSETVSFWGEIGDFISGRPLLSMSTGLLVVGLVVWSLFRGGDPVSEKTPPAVPVAARKNTAARQAANNAQKAIEEVENLPSESTTASLIPIGETRNIMVTTYLKCFHANTYSPLFITPKSSILNEHEDKGLRVDLIYVGVSPVTVSVLERLREQDNSWIPYGYKNVYSQNARGGVKKGHDLLVSSCPAELVHKESDTSWQQDKDAHLLRRGDYTLYRLEAELSMTPPSVPDSPGVRSYSFCISTLVEIDVDDNLKSMMGLEKVAGMSGSGGGFKKLGLVGNMNKNCIHLKQMAANGEWGVIPVDNFPSMPGYLELRVE